MRWWTALLAAFTGAMDDHDSVWEPFLADDDGAAFDWSGPARV
ncbi:hypothetical protein ACE2AJ_09715 [Aquihabitans daechungensis]